MCALLGCPGVGAFAFGPIISSLGQSPHYTPILDGVFIPSNPAEPWGIISLRPFCFDLGERDLRGEKKRGYGDKRVSKSEPLSVLSCPRGDWRTRRDSFASSSRDAENKGVPLVFFKLAPLWGWGCLWAAPYWNVCVDSVYVFIIDFKCDGYRVLLSGLKVAAGPSVGKRGGGGRGSALLPQTLSSVLPLQQRRLFPPKAGRLASHQPRRP